jgi:hypothetical protein
MSDQPQFGYAAIITIRLPGDQEPREIEVFLAPDDPVPDGTGLVKPLAECTLGELIRFARVLETGWAAGREDRTLDELAEEAQLELSPKDAGAHSAVQEGGDWLKRPVLLQAGAKAGQAELVAEPEPVGPPAPEPQPPAEVPPAPAPVPESPAAPEGAVAPARVRVLGRRRPLHHPIWTAADILMNEAAFRDAQAHV